MAQRDGEREQEQQHSKIDRVAHTSIGTRADQLVVAAEAMRVARKRVLVLEDTPFNTIDLVFNKAWDWVLNQRHGIPVPFTFRSREEWTGIFSSNGYHVGHAESYRPKWPTLGMYHHTLFVLERRP